MVKPTSSTHQFLEQLSLSPFAPRKKRGFLELHATFAERTATLDVPSSTATRITLSTLVVVILLSTGLLAQQPQPQQQLPPPQQQQPTSQFTGVGSTAFQAPDMPSHHSDPGIYRPPVRTAGTLPQEIQQVTPATWTNPVPNAQLSPASNAKSTSSGSLPLKPPSAGVSVESKIKKPSSTWSSMISMFASLSLVLALFMGVAWFFRGVTPKQSRSLSKDVVQVLGRTQLAARHNMILIRFGRKLVLVSQQLGQTQTLSEIDDPSEVDHLLGLCEQTNSSSISNSFLDVMTQLTSKTKIALAVALCLFLSNPLIAQNASSTNEIRPSTAREASSRDGVAPLLRAATNSILGQNLSGQAKNQSETKASQDEAETLEGPAKWVSPEGLNGSLQILLLLTVLSLAPAILLMTTCYVRIIVVMGLLRQALGTSQLPPSQVITSISLFITLFVMAPVWSQVYDDAIKPYTDSNSGMTMEQAWDKGVQPVRTFMSRQIAMAGNYDDVHLFFSRHAPNSPPPSSFDDVPLTVLLPAYMLSELKTSFMMGFQIYLPFLILDIVIASVTISMGMMMLPPAMISMPFKLLLFVLVDGWHLVVEMLLDSFGTYGS